MSVSQYQFFLCLQVLLADMLRIHILTREEFSHSSVPPNTVN